ncbi:MAG TPA: hypothetical protein VMS17_03435 [Gemmataceae bacterium]|nr:hypothetical protein [Gemmataceae bacterium]
MQTVTRFEANLLRLLYYFLGQEPAETALPLVEARLAPPPCLSRSAVRLVKDALAKGCVFQLARRGAWRVERHLRGQRVVEGRLWNRTPPVELGLTFSRQTLEFLVWVTATRPGDEPVWRPLEDSLTAGDRLLLYFAHQGLREAANVQQRPFTQDGLCRLAYPEDYAEGDADPNFAPWTDGVGVCILEALQPELVARWIDVEGGKSRITEWQAMRALGRSQERVLTAFLDAVEKAERLALARFLLRAASRLLGDHANAEMWVGGLTGAGPRLADRTATYQSALALLRQMPRLQAWERRARSVGYFDEGYQASQLWKSDWEHYHGEALADRAAAIIRQLDPMRPA